IAKRRGFAIWHEDRAGWPPHCASTSATMAPTFAPRGHYGWARRLGRRRQSAKVCALELRARSTGDCDFMNVVILASADRPGCGSNASISLLECLLINRAN